MLFRRKLHISYKLNSREKSTDEYCRKPNFLEIKRVFQTSG